MSQKNFCDICNTEVIEQDLRFLNITDINKKPIIPQMEICVHCKEEVTRLVGTIGKAQGL